MTSFRRFSPNRPPDTDGISMVKTAGDIGIVMDENLGDAPEQNPVLQPPRCAWFALEAPSRPGNRLLILLSRPRRPRRSGEWTPARAVTFIVTLAATRSVTLAARAAGMSRKAAYALKSRDTAFAGAWSAAMAAGRPSGNQGNKVKEVHGLPFSPGQGNRPRFNFSAELRDLFLYGRAANRAPSVARRAPLP